VEPFAIVLTVAAGVVMGAINNLAPIARRSAPAGRRGGRGAARGAL